MDRIEKQQFAAAKKELAPQGIKLTYSEEYEEYSVLPSWRKQAEYFTNDLSDAIGTAKHMLAARKVKNPGRSRNGQPEQSELYTYITSDGQLYRSQGLPIIKNLAAKKGSGKYNSTLAAKLYGYLAESGAKKYAKEFPGTEWNRLFSVADRKEVAQRLRDDFEAEWDNGSYREYVPKKYQAKMNPGLRRNGQPEQSELYIYIKNDGQLYRQQGEPIIKNLAAKKGSGKYNSTLAAKLYGYLAESGAKKYTNEYARGTKWNEMFSVADRKAVAQSLRDDFEEEWNNGSYREYVPKKYQQKANGLFGTTRHQLTEDAYQAGLRWFNSGDYYSSGVANARVVSYGFSKWYNSLSPSTSKVMRAEGLTKAGLQKNFTHGFKTAKAMGGSSAVRKSNPQVGDFNLEVIKDFKDNIHGTGNPAGYFQWTKTGAKYGSKGSAGLFCGYIGMRGALVRYGVGSAVGMNTANTPPAILSAIKQYLKGKA